MRIGRAVDDQFAAVHHLAFVHQDVLLLGHELFPNFAFGIGDLQTHLAFGFLAKGDGAGDFGQHAFVFGRAGFKQLGHTRQTAGDVAGLRRFAGNAGQDVAGIDPLSVLHRQDGVHRHEVAGFQTIAEGVEDIAQLLELQAAGISIAQGYITTRPCPFLPTGDHYHWPLMRSGADTFGRNGLLTGSTIGP